MSVSGFNCLLLWAEQVAVSLTSFRRKWWRKPASEGSISIYYSRVSYMLYPLLNKLRLQVNFFLSLSNHLEKNLLLTTLLHRLFHDLFFCPLNFFFGSLKPCERLVSNLVCPISRKHGNPGKPTEPWKITYTKN